MQKSSQYALNQIMSPESHLDGGDLAFTGPVAAGSFEGVTGMVCYPIRHNHKTGQNQYNTDVVLNCKGAQVLSGVGGESGVDGILMVHLVEDPDGNWFPLELKAGDGPKFAQFDAIGGYTGIGSTVSFDNTLLIFPADYAQEGQPQ